MNSKYVEGVNEENMDKFLEALRSGEYKQATGRLHDTETGGYCCLGVASEVAHAASEGCISKEVREITSVVSAVFYDGERLLAPQSVVNWLGIPSQNWDVSDMSGVNIRFFKPQLSNQYVDDHTTATEMNDDLNMSFGEIADVFEAEFKKES